MGEPLRVGRFGDGARSFYAIVEAGDRIRELAGSPFVSPEPSGSSRPMEGLAPLVPCQPSKIVGIGRNYRAHAKELRHAVPDEPLLFLKPCSALLPPGGVIRLPAASQRVDYEGEIAVVIGRTAREVPPERAPDFIFGYTCLNDVTARDLQEKDVQFTRAKGFDTFCPVGPWIATGLDPTRLVVETFVNGDRRQSSSAATMIFGISLLVSYVSRIMTLVPGDLIATGTPAGVGPLAPGDEVTVAIEGIGRLTNRVEA
ncbi:MAG TPA: fumarylacetoacetate hydrolase family protein [Candidatus Polarisedimenticolia bacterium]|nr:fumarylacetoacetate hydrolase family protein [Candidatus Polarisedimenticolia bacterium]